MSGFVGEPQGCEEVCLFSHLGNPNRKGLGGGGVFEGGDGGFPDSLVSHVEAPEVGSWLHFCGKGLDM